MAATSSVVRRTPSSSSLYDVLDLILDKGLVIDAYVRVSLVGIEILTIDLRIVIASVDTYLRFAEAVDRLVLEDKSKDLTEFASDMTRGISRGKTGGAIEGAKESVGDTVGRVKEKVKGAVGSGDEDEDEEAQDEQS
ncbi:MAG TPA: gas vesicle protein GvpJ [Acidimicrobiales bacterium]|nr:gas vesicle protein GvpJ [Acidimicrobiales bacterium]